MYMCNKVIKSVCWDITSKCNDSCAFCYRNKCTGDLSVDDNMTILKKLIDANVEKISFVGGEPLLYEQICKLIEFGKKYSENKILFSITTNGILFTDFKDGNIVVKESFLSKIIQNIDWITFSLDAPDNETQVMMGRNDSHFERISTLIKFIKNKYPKKKIKINTIVSKINYTYMDEMYRLLLNYGISRWKLFRFLPSRGDALKNRDKYYITENEFDKVINCLISRVDNKKIRITVNDYSQFDNSYVTISSFGELVVYQNGTYHTRLNLLNESLEEVYKYINVERHNINRTDFKMF